jgi:hypothetical protein
MPGASDQLYLKDQLILGFRLVEAEAMHFGKAGS